MSKFSLRIMLAMMLGLFALASCSDDGTTPPPPEKPDVNVSIDNLSRTELTFTVSSQTGSDYAYAILPKGAFYTTAEAVFRHGEFAMMSQGTATINNLDFEGGKEYTLFVATRKINPYVYSELYTKEISTNLPYTEMMTLEKVGLTSITYHVEVPEGKEMKHIIVKKDDYEAIKNILAMYGEVSHATYAETFGHKISESGTFTIDKYGETAYSDAIHIHSGTTYLAIAGITDENGKIAEENCQTIEFDTRHAGECPYDFNISVETTSISAVANIVPDAGIDKYRAIVLTREDMDYIGTEGEASIRSAIIGPWASTDNEYSGPAEITATGLRPDTEYVLGIVGFDASLNEKVKLAYFTTGSPTGPVPTMTMEMVEHTSPAPWRNAAVNLKAQHAVSITGGFFLKHQVDELLARGSSLTSIVQNNGQPCSAEEVQQALSPEGLILQVDGLNPETEMMFAMVAVNEEYVSATEYITFTTAALPQLGGDVRANMPGKYIASTTDATGATVTFPVTIATGANDATTETYSKQNRLVCLGFGPADTFPYTSPEALGGTDADLNYGPKWFIEFTDNGPIVPTTAYGKDDLDWNMGIFDGKTAYMWAYGKRTTSDRETDSASMAFEVEVSDDGNTITVKSATNSFGNAIYYPTMAAATSTWSTDELLFRCYSEIVLKRQPDNSARAFSGKFAMPRTYTVDLSQPKEKSARQIMCERLSK